MECHSGSMPDHLSCLVETIVGSLPVKDPHLKKRQESWIVDLCPIHLLKPLHSSDHMGPESIIEEQVWICVMPPPIVGTLHVLSSLQDPMEGILGDLENSPQHFL